MKVDDLREHVTGSAEGEDFAPEGARAPVPLEPVIELVDVTKTYRSGELDVEVLHGVSLKIYPGEFLAIMGASFADRSRSGAMRY